MRRLFSTFAHGLPGLGLLLLRLTVGIALIAHGVGALLKAPGFGVAAYYAILAIMGLLLLVGLGTPIVSTLVALGTFWELVSHHASRPEGIFIASMALSLALLGPGAWSVDARLYGWRQISISGRKAPRRPPI
jgi:putative oxidoreductase